MFRRRESARGLTTAYWWKEREKRTTTMRASFDCLTRQQLLLRRRLVVSLISILRCIIPLGGWIFRHDLSSWSFWHAAGCAIADLSLARYPDNSAHASFLVGEKKEEMVWAVNLFARSTSINQVLTTAPRDEVNLRVVDLYDVPVLHFRIYIGFLDIGELPTHAPLMRARGPPIQKAYPYTPASVLELYKSACRLGDPHFSDRVMDRFIELITTAEQYELDFADITALYNSPARESAGRLLFVDLVAAAPGGLDEAEQKADQLPSAFALQLARRVRELAGLPQGAVAAWAGPPEAWCRYHEHTRVGGSCWREGLAENQVAPAEVASESHDAGEGAEANENVEDEVKDAEEETKDGEEGAKGVEEEVEDAKQEGVEDAKQEEDTESQQQKTPHLDEEGPRRDSARYD